MELIKLTNRIYYLPHDETNDRCVIGYISGKNFAIMVDAGASKTHVNLFFDELEKNRLQKPDFCVLTHWHWDHTYGLHATDTISIATTETNKLLKEMMFWTWSEEEMLNRIEQGKDLKFSYPFQNIEYPDKTQICIKPATIEFKEELNLDLGDHTITLKKIENSHSSDCCIIHIPAEKYVFLGDIIYEDLMPETPVYYQSKHKRLVSELNLLDFDIALTGHQPPMSRSQLFDQLVLDETSIVLE